MLHTRHRVKRVAKRARHRVKSSEYDGKVKYTGTSGKNPAFDTRSRMKGEFDTWSRTQEHDTWSSTQKACNRM
jgi:hypothetical protein